MAWVAAGALIGSAIIGGTASYFGGQEANKTNTGNVAATNAMTLDQAREARSFDQQRYNQSLIDNRVNVAEGRRWAEDQFIRSSDFATQQANTQMAFQRDQQNSAQAFNAQQAQDQRAWQEYMSATSYRRAMGDMREAGLNPVLAYAQGGAPMGSGASASVSPSPGASGTASVPSVQGAPGGTGAMSGMPSFRTAQVANVLGPAVSTAMQGARFMQELEQMRANVSLTEAQRLKTLAEATAVPVHSGLAAAQTVTEGRRPAAVDAQEAASRGMAASGHGSAAQSYASAAERRAAEEMARQQLEFGRRYGPGGTDPRGIAGFWEQSGRRAQGPAQSFADRYAAEANGGPRTGSYGAAGDAAQGVASFFGRVGQWIDRQMSVSPDARRNLIRMHHTVQ